MVLAIFPDARHDSCRWSGSRGSIIVHAGSSTGIHVEKDTVRVLKTFKKKVPSKICKGSATRLSRKIIRGDSFNGNALPGVFGTYPVFLKQQLTIKESTPMSMSDLRSQEPLCGRTGRIPGACRQYRLVRMIPLLLALFLVPSYVLADDQDLAKVFARHETEGTMVISSLDGRDTFMHDSGRASRRYPAASTFKILNTLVALEEGAVKGKQEVIVWDGRHYDFPDWNRDQTLESAFRVSCVWYYQELARRVGADTYRDYLRRCSYGKLGEPFDVATFWLDGSLTISAIEQVEFLRRFVNRALPFGPRACETLREIMIVEHSTRFTLRAKSGWAARGKPGTGWYVGWVETGGKVWLFAMNIDILDAKGLALRQQLTREALKSKGLVD